jgi:hypothetical protein
MTRMQGMHVRLLQAPRSATPHGYRPRWIGRTRLGRLHLHALVLQEWYTLIDRQGKWASGVPDGV